jgi:uncharacterized protein YggT (Ycf19 family)
MGTAVIAITVLAQHDIIPVIMGIRDPRRIEGYEPDPVSPAPAASTLMWFRAQLLVWFLTGIVCVLILIRFLLKALGADPAAAFAQFVYGVTDPLTLPFRDLFGSGGMGRFVFEPADLVAVLIYLLLGWAIVMLIRILRPARPIVS